MDETTSTFTPAPPEPPRPAPRRLVRVREHRMIAGVAAGLGEYFNVDPIVFRLGFVVAAFIGGLGFIAYGLLWLLTPSTQGGEAIFHERRRRWLSRGSREYPVWVGVGLLALGAVLLANQIGVWRPAVVWGVALIAVGFLLFRQGRAPARTPVVPEPPSVVPAPLPPATNEAAPSPQPRVRERATLGWVTLGLAIIAIGVVALFQGTGTWHLTADQLVAVPLTVLGIGLVIGAWWGRARGLIVLCFLILPVLFAASLVRVPFTGGFANKVVHPETAQEMLPAYHLVTGQLTLDLRDVAFDQGPVIVTATAVAGRVLVLLPPNAAVQIHAKAGAGEVSLFGTTYDGLKVDVQRTFDPAASTGALSFIQVELNLETSFGQVEVDR